MKIRLLLWAAIFISWATPGTQHRGITPVHLGPGQAMAIAKDLKGNIHIVYGVGDSLMYRSLLKGRDNFSKPELITVIEGLFAFASRGPKIVALNNSVCVVAPTESGTVYSFTKSGKHKWSEGLKVTDVDSVNREGFVALASDGTHNVFAAWLDLRGNKRNKIYGAGSSDGGKTWQRNIEVYSSPDSTVCECCQVSAAMNGDKVYVMFRNWLNGSRDLHIATSFNRGRSFNDVQKLGNGTWPLKGCPMDGGSLTIGTGGVPQTVWRRESTIYASLPQQPETAIGEGRNPAIDMVNETPVYAWTEKGKIVCLLPQGTRKYLGNGTLPVIKTVNEKSVLCMWEHEREIFYSFVNL